MPQHDDGDHEAEHLCDREGVPDGFEADRMREYIGGGEKHGKLARDRHDHAENAVAERLKHRGADDGEAREHKAQADDAQCGDADAEHLLRGLKEQQKLAGDELYDGRAHGHDTDGIDRAETHGLHDAVGAARAVVERDDGHHAVVQAKDRHEDEALELEIDAEYGSGRLADLTEGEQDLVDAIGHERTDRAHDRGRNADVENAAAHLSLHAEAARGKAQLFVFADVQNHGCNAADNLAEDGGDRRSGHAHGGNAEGGYAEDQDRVEDDVGDCTDALRDHGKHRPSGCLKQALKDELGKQTGGENAADRQIILAEGDDLGVVGLAAEKDIHGEEADQNEDQATDDFNENAL